MSLNRSKIFTALAAAGVIGVTLAYTPISQAFNFGDMMNPGKWMGGGGDRYDDYSDGPYGGGPWGGGPYGGGPWGGGPWGGGPYGGGPWGGGGPYGGPGYGAPGVYGAPGYGAVPQVPAAAAPSTSTSSSSSSNVKDAEIEALKRRIDELEAQQVTPPPPTSDWGSPGSSSDWGKPDSSSDWGAAPAFRPMGKY